MANTDLEKSGNGFSVALTEKLESTGIAEALPKDFNKARFVQNALALLNDKPELAKFGKAQLLSGLIKGAYLGLDFYSQEAYLVPYGDKLNFQTGYRGERKLCKKYSIRPIKEIYAKLIREGDLFEESIVDGIPSFNFKPKFPNDGPTIGAFAAVIYQDGGIYYESMTLEELEAVRKQSKAANSPAWKNFPGEMRKKTVLRRLCKSIEIDFENSTQQSIFQKEMEVADPAEQAKADIAENANAVDFDYIDADDSDFKQEGFM